MVVWKKAHTVLMSQYAQIFLLHMCLHMCVFKYRYVGLCMCVKMCVFKYECLRYMCLRLFTGEASVSLGNQDGGTEIRPPDLNGWP